MSIDKLYCYDSMYNDSITITGEPITLDSSMANSPGIFVTNSTNTLNHTGIGNVTIGKFTNTGTISSGLTYPWVTSVNDTITIGDIPQRSLSVRGNAEIDGELTVGGKNIGESLDRIEKRLAILKPNPELEERWERLRELGEEYRKLEQDILGQEEIYNILKK